MRNTSQRLDDLTEKVDGLLRREAEREKRDVAAREAGKGLREKLDRIQQHLDSSPVLLKATSARLASLLHQQGSSQD